MTDHPLTDLLHNGIGSTLPDGVLGVGLDPDDIAAISAQWNTQSEVIGDIDLGTLAATPGPASRVVGALRATPESATACLDGISRRLHAMSVALECFSSTSVDSDEHVARIFGFMSER
ncbi:hypothetical protein ABLE92_03885 [Gordonia sp. VNQ95]|uniref:hypothetical protein n=1 Tax=Gordonia sp. VNQ95 TaxID=3156619 RepID=UPI0032B4E555